MFFKRRSNVIFRDYESFGYITDNRNFGYKQINSSDTYTGDKILSETGAVFISALGSDAQSIDVLARKIQNQFAGIDIKTIKKDAKEFYCLLEKDGFLVSGKTAQECDEKDTRFSYKNIESGISHAITSCKKDTQDFLEEYFEGKPQLTNLHIEITSKCNEKCIHCYIPHDNKINSMEPDLFYDILEQSKNMRLLHLTLSGGEPMLHKYFCDFLGKCKEYNFSVNVLSNLTLLDNKILDEMKKTPLLGVQVSLYAMDSSIHDEITQMKGSFEKTKNAILKLIENDIPLQISCPIMKQNKNCYKEVIRWAGKYKIQVGDDYGIIARYNHTTQNLSCRLSFDEVEQVIVDKIENDSKYMEQLKKEIEKKKDITPNDFVCSVCHSSICIADNGNVYPCAGWQSYVVGNIKETSLNDIWSNSKGVNYLRNLRRQDFPKCIQCADKEFCTMCMVRNANEDTHGDPLAVNEYFCNIVKLNKAIITNNKYYKME